MPHLVEQTPGLTTTRSPFIEESREHGRLYIEQPYDQYSEENHEAWRRLYARMTPLWEKYANEQFLHGVHSLCLDSLHVPRLSDVNTFLRPLTGFRRKPSAVMCPRSCFSTACAIASSPRPSRSGAAIIWITCRSRIFSTTWLATCPCIPIKHFAEALVRFGECAHTAAALAADIRRPGERPHASPASSRRWPVSSGLPSSSDSCRHENGLKAYGSGLLSSYGEIEHALESPEVQRYPIQLEWAINQSFEIDHYQPVLFFVEGFDHLFWLVDKLERWMRQGKLSNVAPGEPKLSTSDLNSFSTRYANLQ